ncbi:IclR family transcriptional regulator [Arthrobacter castelli]|uniref:IclR family transcriptional regulator n=1 Tax=Arthrobacter castelli TaxID=271431 RepID=UPI000406B658|nr:IclR family transcriptional regulator [Arthrobacter castelli]
MAGNTSQPGSSVLARALSILDCFSEETPSLGLQQIAARAALPTSTAHRLATELVSHGLLSYADQQYWIGTRLWEIGELSSVSLHLRESALPYMLELYEAAAENVHLAVLSGNEALYVARLIGHRSVPTVSRMGGRLPLHTTGVGKVLLAFQQDSFVEEYLGAVLARPTAYSVVSAPKLRDEIEQTRERGFALTSQEMTLGNVSIAVPISDPSSTTYASISLVLHTARGDVRRFVPLLRRAAAGISAAMEEHPTQWE